MIRTIFRGFLLFPFSPCFASPTFPLEWLASPWRQEAEFSILGRWEAETKPRVGASVQIPLSNLEDGKLKLRWIWLDPKGYPRPNHSLGISFLSQEMYGIRTVLRIGLSPESQHASLGFLHRKTELSFLLENRIETKRIGVLVRADPYGNLGLSLSGERSVDGSGFVETKFTIGFTWTENQISGELLARKETPGLVGFSSIGLSTGSFSENRPTISSSTKSPSSKPPEVPFSGLTVDELLKLGFPLPEAAMISDWSRSGEGSFRKKLETLEISKRKRILYLLIQKARTTS
ncbi:hypothetical protein EHO60_15255 [Leptospira fletcheri]|uniref:Uncharacterized protein n=1 Tax=Leptospira fletcheri TaxID=2484981 RepID=A0A4R9G5G3_9LEPT|nr:hypothetical protein [Leptospira fletcheri]TGK06395.1 hypothetical protein EHO60_15255 [Leptospira fletcheri]